MKTEENKMSISVVYWSGTGNTQAMAEAVAEGIREAGADAAVMEVSEADAGEPLVSGKKILLFGSYGWGDGEWMRDWAQRMKEAGAVLVREEGIIANEAPDEETLEECRAAGKELAENR